ncbi:MAG: 3-hydroxyacyl-CoA dehydrogenase [Actinobacteria bacterium]|nr:3-hydroxyacyl-CoA dehydrogenase [Actinomycetota bacterium]
MALAIVLHTPTPDEEIRTGIDVFDPQPTPPEVLGDPGAAVRRLAQAIVDVFNGQRPLHQLGAWVTPEVSDQLRLTMAGLGDRQPRRAGVGRVAPGRLPRVVSTRITSPAVGVVEASAVISGAPRSRALALRLEGLDGRWRCTALRAV